MGMKRRVKGQAVRPGVSGVPREPDVDEWSAVVLNSPVRAIEEH